MYLFIQFGSPATKVSCTVAMYWNLASAATSCLIAWLVLALRTWALWNRQRAVGVLLACIYAGAIVAASVFTIYCFLGISTYDSTRGYPTLRGCGANDTPTAMIAAMENNAVIATYEASILILTLLRGSNYFSKPTGLLLVLYRDGT
ncbi:hypothetical protein CALCODRAFT_286001 [Calocera cornea HHB12733]|uniref:Uncharacterized protein n=1 Tax=Calocera cornea HHB12733 TaxID=1353952 RepID=A0A165FWS1_9BASI|nr:hypothetical protein CALCODRAFT_286001 [Calocera cornea HHB12733]